MKAIVKLSDDETRPVVLHAVQHVTHPPYRLARGLTRTAGSRLVFITRGIERAALEKPVCGVHRSADRAGSGRGRPDAVGQGLRRVSGRVRQVGRPRPCGRSRRPRMT